MSLRSSSQQPPVIYVKCDRLLPRIESITYDLSPARGTAKPCRRLNVMCCFHCAIDFVAMNLKSFSKLLVLLDSVHSTI